MNKFDENLCTDFLDVKSCSEKIMQQLGYDYTKVHKKVE